MYWGLKPTEEQLSILGCQEAVPMCSIEKNKESLVQIRVQQTIDEEKKKHDKEMVKKKREGSKRENKLKAENMLLKKKNQDLVKEMGRRHLRLRHPVSWAVNMKV